MEETSSATVDSTQEETEESSKAGKDTEVESVEVEKASKSGDAERGAESGDVGSSLAFREEEKTFENVAKLETVDSLAAERATQYSFLESKQSSQKASENISEYSQSETSGAESIAGDSTTQKSTQSTQKNSENVSEYTQSEKSGAGSIAGDSTTQKSTQSTQKASKNVSEYAQSEKSGARSIAEDSTTQRSIQSSQKASENVSEYAQSEKSEARSTAGDSTAQKSNQSNTRGEENASEYSQSQKSGNPTGRAAEDTPQKCGYQCSPVTPEEIVEDVLCNESDLKENEMQTFDLGGLGDVVVVRQRGQIYALCNECTHYGAPLSSGALSIGRIRCPWHGACFNLATGDIEDFPGLDDLPSLTVSIQPDGGVKVRALRKDFENKRRSRCKATVQKSPELDSRIFVVAGGGPAGQVCAETLREGGFRGKLIMLAAERYLPYERVLLSKAMLTDIEGINLRPKHFYKKYDIELKIGVALVSLNTKEKVIEISTGEKMSYDSIFLATGAG
ncbi:uncharacterized protein GBIM_16062 [Gryllus bimaculatus]|nr:uncharacterized protein GBIM_16062 [Gryllus bimaculatus]